MDFIVSIIQFYLAHRHHTDYNSNITEDNGRLSIIFEGEMNFENILNKLYANNKHISIDFIKAVIGWWHKYNTH